MAAPQLQSGDLFARRFEVDSVLGEGAYGVVYRATDRISNTDTALKVLRPERLAAFTSRWREAAMLRRLALPGVAQLIAEGVEAGRPFLAMEYVEGRGFPRPAEPVPWEMIEGYVSSLLRTLALVHSAGLVHGDVKPANVIINDFGQVRLVDFGLSLSAVANDLESTKLRGTPLYMAPELFSGQKLTPQTDLFAVGTMIFEAMTGGPFFNTTKMVKWVQLLKTKGPPALGDVLQNPDPVASRLTDALLAPNPSRRPSSAWEALSLIDGTSTTSGAEWLGEPDIIDSAIARIEEESLLVGGSEGAGKTALVTQVAQRLRADGRVVHTLRVADRPFESVVRASTVDERLPSVDSEAELEQAAEELVRRRISNREVFAVSNHTSLPDDWTLRLLESLSKEIPGIIIATRDVERANFRLERFDRDSLAELFCGPELGLHLPSRAADILWERTEGRRGLVFAEIESWKRFHLAQEESDGRIKVSDRSLSLLEQGLQTRTPVSPRQIGTEAYEVVCWLSLLGGRAEADAVAVLMECPPASVVEMLERLRDALIVRRDAAKWALMRQPGHFESVGERSREDAVGHVMRMGMIDSEQRFRLALQGEETGAVFGAAITASDELIAAGRRHEALAVLREATLFVDRKAPDSAMFDGLIRRWLRCASLRSDSWSVEDVLWALGDREHELRGLLEALRLGAVSPGPESLSLLRDVEETGDPDVDRTVKAVMMNCIARSGGNLMEHLEEVREWGRARGYAEVESMCLMWESRMASFAEEYSKAARLAAKAAPNRSFILDRINAYLAQAIPLYENFELEESRELARLVRREGRRTGDPNSEVYGELLLLQLALREGGRPEPNLELVEVATLIGYQSAESMGRGQVAAAFERRGEIDSAIDVLRPAALRERPVAGNSIGLMVVAQLAYLEGRRVEPEIIERSRETPHRKNLATVLCAAALQEEPTSAREMMEEVFEMLSPRERASFLYFINPTEVALQLGFDDLVD